jgi:hypothetical protein
VGEEIFAIDVYPRSVPADFPPAVQFQSTVKFQFEMFSLDRKSVELRGMDRSSIDDKYFRIREVNSTRIQIVLKESLDELVDNDTPRNILKFRIQCNSGSNRRNHDVSPQIIFHCCNLLL